MPQTNLFEKGRVVNVKISMWAGKKSLKPIEIGQNRVNDKLVSLGSKWLVPKKYIDKFANIRTKVHTLLDSYGIPFLNSYFIPHSNWSSFIESLDKLRDDFYKLRDQLINNLDELKDAIRKEWEQEVVKSQTIEASLVLASIREALDSTTPAEVMSKFSFGIIEYSSAEEILNSALQNAFSSVVLNVMETVENLLERVEQGNISAKTIKAAKKKVASFKTHADVLGGNLQALIQKIDDLLSQEVISAGELQAVLDKREDYQESIQEDAVAVFGFAREII